MSHCNIPLSLIKGKLTPLMLAAREGHTEVVRVLLSRNDLNTNMRDEVRSQTIASHATLLTSSCSGIM